MEAALKHHLDNLDVAIASGPGSYPAEGSLATRVRKR